MRKHADHRFSATLSCGDLALVKCLRALAEFSQREGAKNISTAAKEERDWRAAGQNVSFYFASALDRDLFKNEVRRLLPTDLLRFDDDAENGLIKVP